MPKQLTDVPATPAPATLLLAEAITVAPAARVLLYGGATLALALAGLVPQGELWLSHPQTTLRDQVQHALGAADRATFIDDVALPPTEFGQFDAVVIDAPQSRVLARRWLVEAHAALHVGGVLWLGGANDGGVQSLIADAAALFGNAQTLVAKRRARVARARRTDEAHTPVWASEPGIALGSWYRFEAALPDGPLALDSLPGIFSYDRLDAGTRMLLDHLGDVHGARVLDLGCGYGVIGLMAARQGAAQVDMLDEDRFAVAAAQRNAAAHGFAQVRVVTANGRADAFRGPYDLVVTNPPFHRGKDVDYTAANGFIAYARAVVAEHGRFVLVANSFLRYDKQLGATFAQVVPLARTASYTIWQATR